MRILEETISTVDYILNSRRKRHLVGGVMISLSLLFGGACFNHFNFEGR